MDGRNLDEKIEQLPSQDEIDKESEEAWTAHKMDEFFEKYQPVAQSLLNRFEKFSKQHYNDEKENVVILCGACSSFLSENNDNGERHESLKTLSDFVHRVNLDDLENLETTKLKINDLIKLSIIFKKEAFEAAQEYRDSQNSSSYKDFKNIDLILFHLGNLEHYTNEANKKNDPASLKEALNCMQEVDKYYNKLSERAKRTVGEKIALYVGIALAILIAVAVVAAIVYFTGGLGLPILAPVVTALGAAAPAGIITALTALTASMTGIGLLTAMTAGVALLSAGMSALCYKLTQGKTLELEVRFKPPKTVKQSKKDLHFLFTRVRDDLNTLNEDIQKLEMAEKNIRKNHK